MPKSVCVKCEVELKPETNGVIVVEMFRDNKEIYKLWEADLWKCRKCSMEVVLGFAQYSFRDYFNKDCKEVLEKARLGGRTIIYDKEVNR